MVEDLVAAEHPVAVAQEVPQQLVLGGGERQLGAGARHAVRPVGAALMK